MSHKETLIQYLKMKIEQEDWHGVSDAANDLRELEAKDQKPFLVEKGIKIRETVIDGKHFIEVARG